MTEAELIDAMQKDVAYLKRKLESLDRKAAALVTINHKDGRPEASAAAMEWQADLVRLRADLLLAHSKSSASLVTYYGAQAVIASSWR